jgi:hypothetical protein
VLAGVAVLGVGTLLWAVRRGRGQPL